MRTVVVFEDASFKNFLPLAYWRAVFELRCGANDLLTKIRQQVGDGDYILFVRTELEELTQLKFADCKVNSLPSDIGDSVLLINGRWLANRSLPDLPVDTVLVKGKTVVAANVSKEKIGSLSANTLVQEGGLDKIVSGFRKIEADDDIVVIDYIWDLVHNNSSEIVRECKDGAKEGKVLPGAHLIGEENIHIGKDTVIQPGVLIDAEEGPVWIGDDVKVLGNAVIQGPTYIGPGGLIQAGAYIREGSSFGPVCKVGGEVEETIIQGYSNKQHYGFLGHGYVGEWVNCGAGMTNSDLKNTYGTVRVSLDGKETIDTGSMFVGVTIGDHSKVGIGVCFPTGSVMGTVSMIAVGGYAPKFTPSLKWITDKGSADYDVDKAMVVAEKVMKRRKVELTDAHKRLFKSLVEITAKYEKK